MEGGWRKYYFRYREYFLDIYTVYKTKPDLKIYLEILLSAVTVAFFLTLALRPTFYTIATLLKNIKEKETTIEKMDTKIQNLEIAQTLYIKQQSNIDLLNESLPKGPDPAPFVRQLEGLANSTGVQVLGLTVGETVLTGESKKEQRREEELIPLPTGSQGVSSSISISGSYPSLFNFLSQVENLRRPIKIDAASLNSSQTREGSVLVLVVTGRAVYLK